MLSGICDNACKRFLAICRKSRALCLVSRLLSPYSQPVLNRDVNMIQTIRCYLWEKMNEIRLGITL